MDYSDLQQALERAEKLCDQVNEAVRHKENTEKLEWLQTHIQFTLDEKLVFNSATNFMGSRRLLHWGKLFKVRGSITSGLVYLSHSIVNQNLNQWYYLYFCSDTRC